MAVLKFLASVALLGTVARCQNSQPSYYQTYPGGVGVSTPLQYSPSIFNRGTARLVPIKNSQQQQVQYHTAATSAPAVVKRGRILQAQSPYQTLESAQTSSAGGGFQYAPHSIPSYRPSPQQYQQQLQQIQIHQQQQQQQQLYKPQIQASPVHHQPQLRAQPQLVQYQQPQQQYQQPSYYIQKSPQVVGPAPTSASGRPLKLIKVKKSQLPVREAAEPEEEEYPGDPNPQYNFSFDIKDDELTNYQNRQEERDGQTIKGSYSVVDPDGYVRTVTYTADPKNGFQAKVTREPTDVKIKFPVPTPAPEQSQAVLKSTNRRPHQTYINPQTYQQQPQYQQSAYTSNRAVYAEAPAATSTVQVSQGPLPSVSSPPPASPFVPRSSRRYSVQSQSEPRQEASASAPQPRVVSINRRNSKVQSSQTPTVATEPQSDQTETDTE